MKLLPITAVLCSALLLQGCIGAAVVGTAAVAGIGMKSAKLATSGVKRTAGLAQAGVEGSYGKLTKALENDEGSLERRDKLNANDVVGTDSSEIQNKLYSTDANSTSSSTNSNEVTGNDLISNPGDNSEVGNQVTAGGNQERTVTDVLSSNDLKPEDVERNVNNKDLNANSYNDVMTSENISDSNKQAVVTALTSNEGDTDNKQRTIQDILSNENTSPEAKQRLVNELLNGEGDTANKQRMINEIINGTDASSENRYTTTYC